MCIFYCAIVSKSVAQLRNMILISFLVLKMYHKWDYVFGKYFYCIDEYLQCSKRNDRPRHEHGSIINRKKQS